MPLPSKTSSSSPPPSPVASTGTKSLRKQALKGAVAIIVIMGLVFSTRSAIDHWNQETSAMVVRLQELDHQIERETDLVQRGHLQTVRSQTKNQLPSWSNIRWERLGLGGLLYLLGLLPSAIVLRTNCARFGKTPRMSTAALAQLFGHLGKYVPGKAMVVVMRAAVLRRDGVSTLTATVSIFVETFMIMAVGATIAGLVILPLDVPSWIKWMALAMAIGTMIPTLPPIIQRMIKRFESRMGSPFQSEVDWSWFAKTWSLCVLSWLLIGGSFSLIVTAIPGSLQPMSDSLPLSMQLYSLSVASIGLAMVVGFASLLPGGAGVREFVLVAIMGLMINPTHSLLSAIATRFVFLGVELLVVSACWLGINGFSSNTGAEDAHELPPPVIEKPLQ